MLGSFRRFRANHKERLTATCVCGDSSLHSTGFLLGHSCSSLLGFCRVSLMQASLELFVRRVLNFYFSFLHPLSLPYLYGGCPSYQSCFRVGSGFFFFFFLPFIFCEVAASFLRFYVRSGVFARSFLKFHTSYSFLSRASRDEGLIEWASFRPLRLFAHPSSFTLITSPPLLFSGCATSKRPSRASSRLSCYMACR